MNHSHVLFDSDPHFIIELTSRNITNESSTKRRIMQHDHNSERFTFECPRFVEGHDLRECNSVEVHFLNIEANSKKTNAGIYTVGDLQPKDGDDETVVFSWLISKNATQLVGQLNFLIRFACIQSDGTIEYVWNTGVYSGITISSGIYNGDAVVEDYTDTLNEWLQELRSNQVVSLEQTQIGEADGGTNVWTATFGDGRTSDFTVKNGSRGETGLVGAIQTISGSRLNVFVGTQAEYEALPENQKQGLFAIISDDASKEELLQAIEDLKEPATTEKAGLMSAQDKKNLLAVLPYTILTESTLPKEGWYYGSIYSEKKDAFYDVPPFYWNGASAYNTSATFPYILVVNSGGACVARKISISSATMDGYQINEDTSARVYMRAIEYKEA